MHSGALGKGPKQPHTRMTCWAQLAATAQTDTSLKLGTRRVASRSCSSKLPVARASPTFGSSSSPSRWERREGIGSSDHPIHPAAARFEGFVAIRDPEPGDGRDLRQLHEDRERAPGRSLSTEGSLGPKRTGRRGQQG